ncbi:Uncharacterized protein TCM_004659 [Theobroma cacao]|uniref:Uncharacterized protein n=1 Tax=Theobroma cacao TaxID=3641 RepID=A0A061DQJ8_THECC|nr:Uncharacterized protein TCM_004659 [Theobroma cacao]
MGHTSFFGYPNLLIPVIVSGYICPKLRRNPEASTNRPWIWTMDWCRMEASAHSLIAIHYEGRPHTAIRESYYEILTKGKVRRFD